MTSGGIVKQLGGLESGMAWYGVAGGSFEKLFVCYDEATVKRDTVAQRRKTMSSELGDDDSDEHP